MIIDVCCDCSHNKDGWCLYYGEPIEDAIEISDCDI